MRIETIPIVLGIIVFLIGAAILWDAWVPESAGPMRDRRRRVRAAINVAGEKLVGAGAVLLGVALVGRAWRFETLTVLVGTALLLWGGILNRTFIRESLLFRGAARRGAPTPPADRSRRLRIR